MKKHILKYLFIIPLILFLFFLLPLKAEVLPDASKSDFSKTISMDFQDASLKDVLKIFSQQSGMNFIASEAVSDRKVTLYLDKVPVDAALEQILTANSLTYEMQEGSNIFIVKETGKPKVDLITKVFYLKYASVSTSRISQEILSSVSSSSGQSSSGTTGSTTSSAGGSSGTGTFAIKDAITKILSSNGNVTEDARTNSLTITDVPSQFPIIEQTIARLDIPLPQVMIEVEMLDVSKNVAEKLGIKIGDQPLNFTGGSKDSYFPQQDRIAEKIGSANAIYHIGTLSMAGLTAALNFLRTQTDTKYLARPKLFTLSNQTAELKITTQEAIGLVTSNTGQSGLLTQTSSAERSETGVSLRVTPQVNPETGEITMFIEPRVSQAKTGGTFGLTTFKDPEVRGTKSIVRIRDGETIMVGGLIRTDFSQTLTKVPILGDIPFFGAIFRHKDISKNEERELIVFITPHIAQENSQQKMQPVSLNLDREQGIPLSRKIAVEKTLVAIENKRR